MRTRTTHLLASAALLFAAWPLAGRLGTISGAVLSVALAVLFALGASGGSSALAMALGALAAFAAGIVAPGASVLGGAVLVAGAYAERTTRVRGRLNRVVHVALAIFGGGIAGGLTASFSGASLAVRVVAIVVAAVLAALPCLVEADDLVSHALATIARDVDEPARGALAAGADLRRNADDALLDRLTARTVRQTWRALSRLAEARLRVQRSRSARIGQKNGATDAVLTMLDARIAEHVAALARAYAAVDAARAAELGLDDAALRTAESAGEALEQVSRAMVDVQP
jgi:MFS family permease